MLKEGFIVPATSQWFSPLVIDKKKDIQTRFCVDCGVRNGLLNGNK